MKQVLILAVLLVGSALSADAYIVNLSCKAVQTISPDCLPENEWREYIAELEAANCGSDTDKEEDRPEEPSETPYN